MEKYSLRKGNSGGYSIPELIVSMVVLVTFAVAIMGAYAVLVSSATAGRMKAAGLGVATDQLEYLHSLPYDYLAIQGGTITTSGPTIPATKQVVSGPYTFTVTTSIQYVDDSYDGCLNYPSAQSYLCRNGPPVSGTPVDANPRDYKLADVVVTNSFTHKVAAHMSTQIAARVAETAGNTGALIVTITDSSGQPIAGASVNVTNSKLSPSFNQTTTTDSNGSALFLDVTPDSSKNFVISASKTGYNTLTTIAANGSLLPTYPNVSVLAQQVTSSTLKIDQVATDSLQINLVDTNGNPKPGAVFSIKGGTKLYTATTDQSYSYLQNAITSDANGQYILHGLVPGSYYVCFNNDLCSTGAYLTSSQSAYGSSSMQPIVVDAGTTSQSGSGPMQLIKLFVSSSSATPRIKLINPAVFSASSSAISTSQLTITGVNLSGAVVTLRQGATVLSSTVVGSDISTSIKRQVDLSGKTGAWEVLVTSGGVTTIQNGISPGSLGGINVTP